MWRGHIGRSWGLLTFYHYKAPPHTLYKPTSAAVLHSAKMNGILPKVLSLIWWKRHCGVGDMTEDEALTSIWTSRLLGSTHVLYKLGQIRAISIGLIPALCSAYHDFAPFTGRGCTVFISLGQYTYNDCIDVVQQSIIKALQTCTTLLNGGWLIIRTRLWLSVINAFGDEGWGMMP